MKVIEYLFIIAIGVVGLVLSFFIKSTGQAVEKEAELILEQKTAV